MGDFDPDVPRVFLFLSRRGLELDGALRDDPPYERLERLSARLEAGLREAATAADMPHQFARVGSMMTLFFAAEPIRDWPTASRCDTDRFAKWFWAMLDRGVYLPCSQYEALFVSAALGRK